MVDAYHSRPAARDQWLDFNRPSDGVLPGLLQYLLHSGLKRFGLRPRLSRVRLLARQLGFQFRAETVSSVFGFL